MRLPKILVLASGLLAGWAPEFGGRKWVLRVRDWPSQNGVLVLVEKAQYLHTPFINRKNELIVFRGRKTRFRPQILEPRFDHGLPEPGCMGSIIAAGAGGDIFFSNPGNWTGGGMDRSGRMDGRVRRSRDCVGLPSDGKCNWDRKTVTISQGQPFGYSCLTEINDTHVGLLWETNAPGCSASSGACLQVFSTLPLSLFE